MTVYVEYVIVNNFIANYAVIKVTNRLSLNAGRVRFWVSVTLATAFGTFSPLIPVEGLLTAVIKLAVSGVIVAVLAGRVRFKRYIMTYLMFYGVSFGIGGAVSGIVNFISFTGVEIGEERLTFAILLGCVIFRYISGQALSYIKSRKMREEGIIHLVGTKGLVRATAFIDSGNTVCFRGEGVAFIKCSLKGKLAYTETNSSVEVTSVGGKKIFEVYKIKASFGGESTREIPAVFWEGGDFDVILSGGSRYETN